jgi:myo-inositol-1(or 4)-monophosphatase
VALEAARAGASLLREAGLPRPGGTSSLKGQGDYVTESDRQSEAVIVELLGKRAPGIAVLAEEGGGARQGTRWAVDPLDGTTNFLRGFPVVGVSVALIDAGKPVLGVVIAPYLGFEFAAAAGRGVTLNGEKLSRLPRIEPEKAVVATGFPFRNKARWPRHRAVFEKAFARFEDVRRAGAASLDLAWSAAGTFDGFFELNLGTWDVAAGAALVLEAGGRVTDWDGGDAWLESGDIIAASPAVHEALLELAAGAPKG